MLQMQSKFSNACKQSKQNVKKLEFNFQPISNNKHKVQYHLK
jgi:hypothetical protein